MIVKTFIILLFLRISNTKLILNNQTRLATDSKLIHSASNSRIYLLDSKKMDSNNPSIQSLIKYVIEKDKIEFKINRREFVLEPMKKIMMKNGNSTWKNLGYFERITTHRNEVVLMYSNGDKSISGIKYNSMIRIAVGNEEETFRYEIKNQTHTILIKLNKSIKDLFIKNEKKVIAIISDIPTIGSKIANSLVDTKIREESDDNSFRMNNKLFDTVFTITSDKLARMAERYTKQMKKDQIDGRYCFGSDRRIVRSEEESRIIRSEANNFNKSCNNKNGNKIDNKNFNKSSDKNDKSDDEKKKKEL